MKQIISVFVFLVCNIYGFAQDVKKLPLSVAYFSQAAYQPGVKIGTHFDLKNWTVEGKGRKGLSTRSKNYFISPQIGFYSWSKVHSSLLINADFGLRSLKVGRKTYAAYSIGLGFMNQSQITSWKVDLASGIKEKKRENWSWFLPTLNYEFGKQVNSKIGWYSKFSYGLKVSPKRENASIVFVELGLKYNLTIKRS